jgi:hypothetical protein
MAGQETAVHCGAPAACGRSARRSAARRAGCGSRAPARPGCGWSSTASPSSRGRSRRWPRRRPASGSNSSAWPRRSRPGRGLLLGLGSVLVALAALIFAVVAWVRLGDTGRARLLLGATLVAVAGAAASFRRLPATAEALGGLALALVLVDWYTLRRAGVAAGWSATAWWALGTGTGATLAAAAGVRLRVQRPVAALLGQVSAALAVAAITDAPWTAAAGLALVAAAATAGAARLAKAAGWPAAATFAVGAGLLELAALEHVLRSPVSSDGAGAGGPAAALAAMALAPAVAWAMLPAGLRRAAGDGLVAMTAGALLAGAAVLLAAVWASWSLLAAVAVLGAVGAGAGRVLPRPLRRGATAAAWATVAAGMVGLLEPLLLALAAPLAWVVDPWTAQLGSLAAGALGPRAGGRAGLDGGYPAIIGLLACAAAAGLAAMPRPGPLVLAPRLARLVGTAATACLLAVLPLAAGWPVWAALLATAAGALATGAGTVLLDRASHPLAALIAGCAAGLVVLAGAWALATETGTLIGLGLPAATAAVAAGAARSPWLRQGLAAAAAVAVLGESGAAVAGAGGAVARAGFAVTLAAGAVLVAGAVWRDGAAEGPITERSAWPDWSLARPSPPTTRPGWPRP